MRVCSCSHTLFAGLLSKPGSQEHWLQPEKLPGTAPVPCSLLQEFVIPVISHKCPIQWAKSGSLNDKSTCSFVKREFAFGAQAGTHAYAS